MGLGSGIRDLGSGKNLFRIPDPGVKKAPDPGSGTLPHAIAGFNAHKVPVSLGSDLVHFVQLQKQNSEQVLQSCQYCFSISCIYSSQFNIGYNNVVVNMLKYFSHYMTNGRIQIKDGSL